MPSYLITGNSGSGKSSVIEALRRRGYTAYNTDDLPATRLEDMSGRAVDWPPKPIDWSKYAWNWQGEELKKLLASDETVFVGAIVSNQAQFYDLFDKIFVLTATPATVRRRLLNRTNNDFGKHPDELKGILAYHVHLQKKLLRIPTAVTIDANRPLDTVVDDIVAAIST